MTTTVLPQTMTENGITYRLDETTQTYLPDWKLPEQKPIGKYGLIDIVNITLHIFSKIASSDENPHSHVA